MSNETKPARACFREGPRVYLRALTPDDIPQWAVWFNDREVTADLNKGIYPNTLSQQTEVFDRLHRSRTDVQLAVVSAGADALAGIIGLHQIDWVHRRAEISVVIGERGARGKGVATEAIGLIVDHAFEKLNLHKLAAGMWATNTGSRRAFEKNGFSVEATLRESYWSVDRYVDEIRLGLLRQEWDARRGAGGITR